jgi:hypothetical protein
VQPLTFHLPSTSLHTPMPTPFHRRPLLIQAHRSTHTHTPSQPSAMQHEHPHDQPAGAAPSPLDRTDVLRTLWPSLCTDGRRALRRCCKTMRDAVDAHASSLVQWDGAIDAEALSPAACARLSGVHKLTLRSMACLRRMLVTPPQLGEAFFPRLQSLHLLLHEVGRRSGGVADAMRMRALHMRA